MKTYIDCILYNRRKIEIPENVFDSIDEKYDLYEISKYWYTTDSKEYHYIYDCETCQNFGECKRTLAGLVLSALDEYSKSLASGNSLLFEDELKNAIEDFRNFN